MRPSAQTKRRTARTPSELGVFVDRAAPRTLGHTVYDQLRTSIIDGRLRPGERLPASRVLAAELGVARQTITSAYELLVAEGYALGRGSAGTYVGGLDFPAAAPAIPSRPAVSATGRAPFDQRPGAPDPALFPVAAWRRCLSDAAAAAPVSHNDPGGLPALRVALAGWIQRSRGVEAEPDQVIVTCGAQQALELSVAVCAAPGELVAVEEPGYAPVRRVCRSLGVEVQAVGVDPDGLDAGALDPRARAVYVTPSHQYPLGVVMSLSRRLELLRHAVERGATIIEDDYDSEYRHGARPLEPLHRLDRHARVIYVGTFSKVLSPALRLGFAVLPPDLVGPALERRTLTDAQPAEPIQAALARFIADGHLARHLHRTRPIYSERHARIVDALDRLVDGGLLAGYEPTAAGLHVTAWLPPDLDEADVIARAARHGVGLGALAPCWSGPGRPGLMVGFGAIATDQITPSVEQLAAVLRAGAASAGSGNGVTCR